MNSFSCKAHLDKYCGACHKQRTADRPVYTRRPKIKIRSNGRMYRLNDFGQWECIDRNK